MKIDPFQCIAVCISVKHFTSFLLLKGWPSSKQLINALKKILTQLTVNFGTCVGLLSSRVVILFHIGGPSRFCSVPDWRDFSMNQLTFDHVKS